MRFRHRRRRGSVTTEVASLSPRTRLSNAFHLTALDVFETLSRFAAVDDATCVCDFEFDFRSGFGNFQSHSQSDQRERHG